MNKKLLLERRATLLNEANAIAADTSKTDVLAAKVSEIAELDRQIQLAEQLDKLNGNKAFDKHLAKEVDKRFTMRALYNSVKSGKMDGFIAELSQEGENQMKGMAISKTHEESVMMPFELLNHMAALATSGKRFKNDMTSTGQTSTAGDQGGDTLDTLVYAFSDYLEANSLLGSLGAMMLPGLTSNGNLTRGAVSPTFAWEGENDAAAETTPNTAKVAFNPKRVGGFIDVSVMLGLQNPVFERRLARALLNGLISAWERGGINGGGTNEPTGILGTSGIGAVFAGGAASDGTNAAGAATVWKDWTTLEMEVAIDNAMGANPAYLTNPKVRAALKNTAKFSNSNSPIWESNVSETPVNGYRVGVTTNVPSTITKGGSGATLSAAIFGDFSKLILGQWGGMEVMLNPYTRMKEGITEMFLNAYVNAAVIEPRAFAACDDIVA